MKLTREEFGKIVGAALADLPEGIRARMENIDVVVEDQASTYVLSEMGIDSPVALLGLYQGVPLERRGFAYGNVLPDKITLYQVPIQSICVTKEGLEAKIREVVIHEVGHYFGLNDARLRELERENEK